MSSLLDRITTRLDRLRAPPSEVKRSPRSADVAPVPQPVAEQEPATLAGLRQALDRLADERFRQAAIISGAEADRDRIMDDADGDDAELLEIDRRVALARLALDRLSRLEGEAFDALEPLELQERQARWAAARDCYLQHMRTVHEAMEGYEKAANTLWFMRSRLFNNAAPGWDEIVPRLPHLMRPVPGANGRPGGFISYNSDAYKADAERFSTMMIGIPTPPNNYVRRLERYIEGKLDLAEVAPAAGLWGNGMDDPAEHPVLIRLSRKITLPDEVLAVGTVLKVRAAHAREMVTANRAELSDTLTTFAGQHPAGADLPVRELPIPTINTDASPLPRAEAGA